MFKKSVLFLGLSLVTAHASQHTVRVDEANRSVWIEGAQGAYVASDSQVDEKLSPIKSLQEKSVALAQRHITADGILELISQDNLRVVESSVGLFIPDISKQGGRLIATYDVRNCHCLIFRSSDRIKAGFVHITEYDFKSAHDVLSPLLVKLDPKKTDVFLLTSWVSDITSQLSDYLTSRGFAPTYFSSKRAFLQDPYGYSVKYLPYDGVGASSFEAAKEKIRNRTFQLNTDYLKDRAFGLDTATGEVFELSNLAFQAVYEQKNFLSPSQVVKLSLISLDDRKKSIVRANQSSGQLRIDQLNPKPSK